MPAGTVATLHDVIDALPGERDELNVTVADADWSELIADLSQHVAYGQTIRGNAKCATKRGKPTRCYFCVWITRTDSGRYEFGCNT